MIMADKNSPPGRKNKTDPGGDLPRRFYDEQPYKVELSDQLFKTNRELAQRNLEVRFWRRSHRTQHARSERLGWIRTFNRGHDMVVLYICGKNGT
jgi:hypothetical protein